MKEICTKLGEDILVAILQLISHLCGQVGRAFTQSVEGREFELPVGSSQRLKNWYLLLPPFKA